VPEAPPESAASPAPPAPTAPPASAAPPEQAAPAAPPAPEGAVAPVGTFAAGQPPASPAQVPATAEALGEPASPPVPGAPAEDALDGEPDDLGETVVVRRTPVAAWHLVSEEGARYALSESVVVLGRRPAGDEPGVQYLAVSDPSRTLSKQHACLTLADGAWTVADLGSTNGVFVESEGVETRVPTGRSVPVSGRLVLGTLGLRIERADAQGGAR
jgi:hypothetical protein